MPENEKEPAPKKEPAAEKEKDEKSPMEKDLVEELGSRILSLDRAKDGKITLKVPAEELLSVVALLKEKKTYAFDVLHCVVAVDYPKEESMEVIYHLFSMTQRCFVVLKVRIPRDKPELPSLCSLYPGANWLEREQYDLLGVRFTGHPDLRRILLPDYWPGFPLRKDWVEPDYRELTRMALDGAFDT